MMKQKIMEFEYFPSTLDMMMMMMMMMSQGKEIAKRLRLNVRVQPCASSLAPLHLPSPAPSTHSFIPL